MNLALLVKEASVPTSVSELQIRKWYASQRASDATIHVKCSPQYWYKADAT